MSQMRRCDIFKASDDRWYMILGNFEYAEDYGDCTVYGPFRNDRAVELYLNSNFSNPGGYYYDDSGIEPAPENPVNPSHNNRRWY